MTKGEKQAGGGCAVLIGLLIVIVAVLWALSSLGHVLGLTPSYSEITDRPDGWVSGHYRGVAWGFVLTVVVIGIVLFVGWTALRSTWADPAVAGPARDRLPATAGVAAVAILVILVLPVGERSASEIAAYEQAAQESGDTTQEAAEPAGSAVELVRVPQVEGRSLSTARRRIERAGFDVEVLDEETTAGRRCRVLRQSRHDRSEPGETIYLRARCRDRPVRVAPPDMPDPEADPTPAELEPTPGCDPNYEGACLKPDSIDYDCEGGSGDGPDYTGSVTVVGDDHYGLDRDGDGAACE